MNPLMLYAVIGFLTLLTVGGAGFALVGMGGDKSKKRLAAVSRSTAKGVNLKGGADTNQQRRKNVQQMLKDLESKQAEQKKRPSIRRRIEMAGLTITPRTFYLISAVVAIVVAAALLVFAGQTFYIAALGGFAGGFGLPRWVLGFLKRRREKAFTKEFATAIDIIVRSVKTGLPVNEALKVVGSEISDPVGSEFRSLVENLKVGVTMDQGLKRMFERMPTAEVNFFGIVMAIQQKAGGNLSEALTNLSNVLRDRKRMQGKIKAMSSEAKASAAIIGSLPPGVMTLIYITTPDYIGMLFKEDLGNLMLMGCLVWMSLGILVMKKMISFNF